MPRPRGVLSDVGDGEDAVVARLESAWDQAVRDVTVSLQVLSQQRVDRKRKRDERPHVLLAELVSQVGADEDTPIHELITMLATLSKSAAVDVVHDISTMKDALQTAFQQYRQQFVLAANVAYFIPQERMEPGYTSKFFRMVTLANCCENEPYRLYARDMEPEKFQLLADTMYYIRMKMDPPRLRGKRVTDESSITAADYANTATTAAADMRSIHKQTHEFFDQLKQQKLNNTDNMMKVMALEQQIIPRLNAVVTRLALTKQFLERDPVTLEEDVYVQHNRGNAASAKLMLQAWHDTLEKENLRTVENTITKYQMEYENLTSHTQNTHIAIQAYLDALMKATTAQLLIEWGSSSSKCFEKCREFVNEVLEELQLFSRVEENVLHLAAKQIQDELKKDCVRLQKPMVTEVEVSAVDAHVALLNAQASCSKLDLATYARHISQIVDTRIKENREQYRPACLSLIQAEMDKLDQFQMLPLAFSMWHTQLKQAHRDAIEHIKQRVLGAMSSIMKDIDTWYLVHVKQLIAQCQKQKTKIQAAFIPVPTCDISKYTVASTMLTTNSTHLLQKRVSPMATAASEWFNQQRTSLDPSAAAYYRTWIQKVFDFDDQSKASLQDAWEAVETVAKLHNSMHLPMADAVDEL